LILELEWRWCDGCNRARPDRAFKSAAGAGQAFGRGGRAFEPFFRNIVTALNAIAELAAVDPRQGRLKAVAVLVTQALSGFGHGLILQRIHARKPADRPLIKGDHLLSGPAQGVIQGQLRQRIVQHIAVMFKLRVIHIKNMIHHRIAFCQIVLSGIVDVPNTAA
jgi:hypothetical protein